MAKYNYKAKRNDGVILEGTFEAESIVEVKKMLRQRSYYPINIKPIVESSDIQELGLFSRLNSKLLSVFCSQFATLLNAGVSITRCLEILTEQTTQPLLKKLLKQISDDVTNGMALSDSLKTYSKHFPNLMIYMIEAGELSGTLDKTLTILSEHFEKDYKTKNKIKSAMTYPVIVLLVTICVTVFLLTFVVPRFTSMFEGFGAELPTLTRVVLSLSAFMVDNWLAVLIGIVVIILSLKAITSTDVGKYHWHRIKLKLPLFGKLTRNIVTARFTRLFGILLGTGVPLTEALESSAKLTNNAYIEKGLYNVVDEVKLGTGLAKPIGDLGVFPKMVYHMINVGEESGTLEKMLEGTAKFFDDEVDNGTKRMITLMEPAIILFLGGIVAVIVLSIVLPMFEIYNHI